MYDEEKNDVLGIDDGIFGLVCTGLLSGGGGKNAGSGRGQHKQSIFKTDRRRRIEALTV